jgi:hypothetical protein
MRNYITLKGSHRVALKGHRKGKEIAPNTRLTATIQLESIATTESINSLIAAVKAGHIAPLTPAERIKVLGAHPAHVRQLNEQLRAAGINPVDRELHHRVHGNVPIEGTYAAFKKFSPGLELRRYTKKGKVVIGREGELNVPDGLHITGFFGLDEREVAHTNFRIHRPSKGKNKPHNVPNGATSRDLAAIQGWDLAKLDAAVRVTAYISLGGDNIKIDKDLKTLCTKAGINTPLTVFNPVGGVKNGAYTDDATVENTLDKLAQGLLNPNGAIVCFMAGNTDDDFASAAEAANVFKGVKIKGKLVALSGVSISWGMGESNNTPDSLDRWGRIGQSAQLGGIDYTAATGDNGPKDNTEAYTPDAPSCVPGIQGAAGVGMTVGDTAQFSAVDPDVILAVIAKAVAGGVLSTFPWNDTASGGGETGYGISGHFAPEAWEAALKIAVSAATGKAGHSASMFSDLAQPASCAYILYNGQMMEVGGTSHSAPFQIAKLTSIKVAFGVTLMLALAETHGADMADQITVGDDSDPYPALTTAVYNIMTGFGVLNQSKCEAVAAASKKGN